MSSAGSLTNPLNNDTDSATAGRRFTWPGAALVLGLLSLMLAACILFSLTVGSTSVGMLDLIFPSRATEESATILLGVRLPRIMLAAAVGACLSAAGVCFQALLRNPLADPYILGISGGAGLGAILATAVAPAAGLTVRVLPPAGPLRGSGGRV